jgi:hypothetical protein
MMTAPYPAMDPAHAGPIEKGAELGRGNWPRVRRALVWVGVLAVLALAGSGCGGGSKPEYCSKLSDLETSVKDLGDIQVATGGKDAVRKALEEVETNARSTVAAAKSDFPSETSAITVSISSVKTSAQELAASPTPQQVGPVALAITSVVTSVDKFADATKSECD